MIFNFMFLNVINDKHHLAFRGKLGSYKQHNFICICKSKHIMRLFVNLTHQNIYFMTFNFILKMFCVHVFIHLLPLYNKTPFKMN